MPFLPSLLSTLFLTLLPLCQALPSIRNGHTYFPCTTSDHCVPPLTCTDTASTSCHKPPCFCLPPSNSVRLCLNSEACPPGEVCATGPNVPSPFCIDSDHVSSSPSLKELNIEEKPVGLSYDLCTTDAGCSPPYICRADTARTPCPPGGRCLCLPPKGLRSCSNGCKVGEVCASGKPIGRKRCVSIVAVSAHDDIRVAGQGGGSVPPATTRPAGSGLAFDQCTSATECKPPRQCYLNKTVLCEQGSAPACSCQYDEGLKTCDGATDCDTAEQCMQAEGQTEAFCVSEVMAKNMPDLMEVTETTTGETEQAQASAEPSAGGEREGCVDVGLLAAFGETELVYKIHLKRSVLCDVEGSCATGGHVVLWKGKAMKMGTYCEIVGCVRKVVLVNSPSWRRGLRVESRTNELVFTAFSAKYETRMEEVALGLLVRIGL